MKKVYKLKKWVKEVIINSILILLIIGLVISLSGLTPEEEDALNYCMNQGYSQTHCEHNLFGN